MDPVATYCIVYVNASRRFALEVTFFRSKIDLLGVCIVPDRKLMVWRVSLNARIGVDDYIYNDKLLYCNINAH